MVCLVINMGLSTFMTPLFIIFFSKKSSYQGFPSSLSLVPSRVKLDAHQCNINTLTAAFGIMNRVRFQLSIAASLSKFEDNPLKRNPSDEGVEKQSEMQNCTLVPYKAKVIGNVARESAVYRLNQIFFIERQNISISFFCAPMRICCFCFYHALQGGS